MKIEFFWTPVESRLMVHTIDIDKVEAFGDDHHGLARRVDNKVMEYYPVTHKSLCRIYGAHESMYFPRAKRFLKCNFSIYDSLPDIDDDFNFNLEVVPCPLRGECLDCICNPKMTTKLSSRELDVIRLHVEGLSPAEIGGRLYISPITAHNHFTNIYHKLNFTGKPLPGNLLITYAYKNHLV